MSLLTELEAHAPEYIEWRHTFHEHPELGLETPWTADLVAAKLRSFGIEVTQGVGRFRGLARAGTHCGPALRHGCAFDHGNRRMPVEIS